MNETGIHANSYECFLSTMNTYQLTNRI